jgi:hypothetical protein
MGEGGGGLLGLAEEPILSPSLTFRTLRTSFEEPVGIFFSVCTLKLRWLCSLVSLFSVSFIL